MGIFDFFKGRKNGPKKYYHNNGTIRREGNYNNNEKDGIWKSYYENGQLKEEGNYNNNEKDGVWKSYYQNGQLEGELYWKDNKKNGPVKGYFSNGKLYYEYNNTNGMRSGIGIWYGEDGLIEKKIPYKNDVIEGEIKDYYDNGQLKLEEYFKNGFKILTKDYYNNGRLKTEKICYQRTMFGNLYTNPFSEKKFNEKGLYEKGGRMVHRFFPKFVSTKFSLDSYNQFIKDSENYGYDSYKYIEIDKELYYKDILDGEKLKILVVIFYQTIKSIGGPLNTNKLVIQNLGNIYFCLEELKNNYKDFFYNTKKSLPKDLMEVHYPEGKKFFPKEIKRELILQDLSDYYDEYEKKIISS